MEGAVGTWQRETRAALLVGQILPTFLQVCAYASKSVKEFLQSKVIAKSKYVSADLDKKDSGSD